MNDRSRRRNHENGFTLIEVLITLMMIGVIMTATYAVLFTTIVARDRLEKENLEGKIGPAILDLIEKDVGGTWCWNIHSNDVFKGEAVTVSGENADAFHFTCTTNSSYTMPNDNMRVASDLTEVSYRLRQNPRNRDYLELRRRQDFHLDDRIAEGGIYELIYSRVRSFQVIYYADLHEDAEKLDEWDASKRGRLPAAMEIFLSIEIDPTLAGYSLDEMERSRLDYHRVIFFPKNSELTMGVRPVIPTFEKLEDDTAQGGGGGSVGDGGGGGGGGDDGFGGEGGGPEGGDRGGGQDPGAGEPPPFDPPPDFPEGEEPEDMDLTTLLRLLNGN